MLTNSKNGGGHLNRPFTKQGFTLIEVLGIIIVLGIVSVITVPFVYRVIESSKKNAFKETVEGIVKATDVYYARNNDKMYQTFQENGGMVAFIFDENLGKEGITAEGYKIGYSGTPPIAGKVLLYNDGTIEVENLTNGRYYANKDADTQIVITDTSTILTREELTKKVQELLNRVDVLEKSDTTQKEQIKSLESENKTLKAQVQTNTTGVGTNKTDIANLKKQVDTNTTNISNMSKEQLNKTYPVGSIYISTNSTSPATLFGGTWEAYGTGRTLVGINTNDGNFNTIGKTGGSTTTTLAAGNLPSHTHSIPALGGSTSTTGNHSHTTAAINITNGSTSSAGAHTHTYSGTTSNAGSHYHNIYNYNPSAGGWNWIPDNRGNDNVFSVYVDGLATALPTHGARMAMNSAGAHTHTFSGTTSSAGAHTHTVSGTVPAQTTSTTGNHSHTLSTTASTTGATGSGSAFTNLQPYITVYMWRRTA